MATNRTVQARRRLRGFRAVSQAFNRFVLLLAGTRLMPLYGVVEHRGRRSGKTYRTPVVVRRTAGGFVVPLPWGDTTDWCRNIRAAGGCTVRWNGRDYAVADPELVDDPAAVRRLFGATQRPVMALFGIDQCLRLRQR